MESSSEQFPQWHNLVAGAVAGAGSRLATAPLDIVRIRWQLEKTVTYPRPSLWSSMTNIVQNEGGILALFRGSVAATYLWVGYSMVQFVVYGRIRSWLESHDDQADPHRTLVAFCSGGSAGMVATLITYPFDLCRTVFAARGVAQQPLKVQSKTTFAPPKTLYEFAYSLYHKRGVRAFYAGYTPALLQIVPYMGLSFAIYDRLTRGDKGVGKSGLSGSVAGTMSKIAVYPIDTVKRRLQAQAVFGSTGVRYEGMVDCFTKMLRKEGPTSFYRGLVPSVMKAGIASSLTFSLYRGTKNILEDFHKAD